MAIISPLLTRNYYRKCNLIWSYIYGKKINKSTYFTGYYISHLFMLACWFILAISINKDNIEEYY